MTDEQAPARDPGVYKAAPSARSWLKLGSSSTFITCVCLSSSKNQFWVFPTNCRVIFRPPNLRLTNTFPVFKASGCVLLLCPGCSNHRDVAGVVLVHFCSDGDASQTGSRVLCRSALLWCGLRETEAIQGRMLDPAQGVFSAGGSEI